MYFEKHLCLLVNWNEIDLAEVIVLNAVGRKAEILINCEIG